jgi:hypothetical protein
MVRRLVIPVLLSAAFAAASGASASAATRPPIKDCGDVFTIDRDHVFLGAITSQGGACANARAVARKVLASAGCKTRGSCRIQTYTCLLARAAPELTLVHCENRRQTAFIRFEFGS